MNGCRIAAVMSITVFIPQELMARLDIAHFFEARVTAEDGTETIAESLLSAAYKLQRPPNQCVVFDGSPSGIAAAHNCTMKVGTAGATAAVVLKAADMELHPLGKLFNQSCNSI